MIRKNAFAPVYGPMNICELEPVEMACTPRSSPFTKAASVPLVTGVPGAGPSATTDVQDMLFSKADGLKLLHEAAGGRGDAGNAGAGDGGGGETAGGGWLPAHAHPLPPNVPHSLQKLDAVEHGIDDSWEHGKFRRAHVTPELQLPAHAHPALPNTPHSLQKLCAVAHGIDDSWEHGMLNAAHVPAPHPDGGGDAVCVST